MVRSNEEYLSNSLTYVYKPEIGQRIKYTANTGTTTLITANSNLDGTGTSYTALTAGSSSTNGTLIKTITLKGTLTTTRGMVRLYLLEPGTFFHSIITEIEIPAVSQDNKQKTFEIAYEVDFMITKEWLLKASIQNGSENMVIITQGLDITFP